jgi:hypothetical protein
MGVVDEPVEDGVGDGQVGDDLVLVVDRQLARHDGRHRSVARICHRVRAKRGAMTGSAQFGDDGATTAAVAKTNLTHACRSTPADDRGIFPHGSGLRCAYPGYGLLQLADGRAGFARGNPG